MQKWIFLFLFIGAGVLGIVVLFDVVETNYAERQEANAPGSKLAIEALNWKFDQAEYTLNAGEETKVSLINKEGIHAIQIKGEGVDVQLDRNTSSQMVTFNTPGTYEIICVLPCGEGHLEMKAILKVV
jgi:cytochrome c oxidase subunit 2